MARFYIPILLLQLICLYHAYKNNAEQRWYWLIVFFPLVGSILYFIIHFNNRSNLRTINEGVKQILNSNYRTEQLEAEYRRNDSVTNRILLADEYCKLRRYSEAIELYKSCLAGFMSDDLSLLSKLLTAYYDHGDFASVVGIGERLKDHNGFKKSEERVLYAWALYKNGDHEEAKRIFADTDVSFSYYRQRTEYCKFLLAVNESGQAKAKLTELVDEIRDMRDTERRINSEVIREIRDLHSNATRVN